MSEDRRLAAIVFSDIVGFTELMGSNEKTAMALLDQQRKLLRPIIENFGGEWLKEMGDGILSSFPSAVKAVTCSLEIQRILEHNSNLTVRIGIHIGDVIKKDGDVFGDGVNIASRLEPLAEPGGICVSERVYDDIRNKPEITANFQDEQILKGVDRPIKVYSIFTKIGVFSQNIEEVKNTKTGSASNKYISMGLGILLIAGSFLLWNYATSEPALETYNNSIAVIPFDNYSTAEEDAFIGDGVTEVIIANLAKIKDLKVISRTSVMQYKNTEKTIKEIGRELGVENILEGSIQRAGDKVRIVGQLINSKTDEHVWAETYDGSINNFFDFQSDIALKIANALKTTISDQANELINNIPTNNMQAWELYLLGLNYYRKSNRAEDMVSARTYFDAAYHLDSLFIEPLAMSANSDLLIYWMGFESRDKMVNSAKNKIDKAKFINPRSPQIFDAEGTYNYYGFRDYLTALNFYRQASELEPGNGDIIANIGYVQRRMGNLKASIKTHEKALALNPNNPDLIFQIGETYRHLRLYANSYEMSKKKLALYPGEVNVQIEYVYDKVIHSLDLEKMHDEITAIKQKFLIENHEDVDQILFFNILSRKYDQALSDLSYLKQSVLKVQNEFLPKNYMKAELIELSGNTNLAEELYRESLKELKSHYHEHPNDTRIVSQLALNYAILGDSVNAVNLINSARNFLPIEKDPLVAPYILNKEAEVYLRLDNIEKCLELLEYSASIPAGIHALDLLHPKWDKFREHPRFINIFNSLPPNNSSGV